MNKKLHIVCFDVPYPTTYGGVMDVFYKIQSLHSIGIEIYLHAYKDGRPEQAILEDYCSKVYYYKRKSSFIKALGPIPYIVNSRNDQRLLENIKRINAPVLFEGLHSTYLLRKKVFNDRKLLVRAHNIEHHYYKQLRANETNLFKKIYYWSATIKLKHYENVLNSCDQILSISKEEAEYFSSKYGEKVTFLPAFHPNKQLHELTKKGYFALYHGNLRIADNMKAALFLIEVFKSMPYPLVIAGFSNDKKLLSKVDQYKNISFISIADEPQLLELFHRAHVNVLYSKNDSGVKLKLINSLFQSRFVIGNDAVIRGSGLESLCLTGNNEKEIKLQILKIMDKDFSKEETVQRKELLKLYSNKKNAELLVEFM